MNVEKYRLIFSIEDNPQIMTTAQSIFNKYNIDYYEYSSIFAWKSDDDNTINFKIDTDNKEKAQNLIKDCQKANAQIISAPGHFVNSYCYITFKGAI